MSSTKDKAATLLAKVYQIQDPFKRRLYVLAVATWMLAQEKSRNLPILVGGAAEEFYSLGGYATYDMDVVLGDRDRFGALLLELGFSKCPGERHWYHEGLNIAIEVPDSVLAGSTGRIATVDVEGLNVYVIGIEDLIMDRLRVCVYRQSESDCEWASRLMAMHIESIDWDYLEELAEKENLGTTLTAMKDRS